MKKYIFLLLAACQGLATMAQENVAYKLKVNLASGEKLAFRADEVDSITFANYEKVQVNLSKRFVTSTTIAVNIELQENSKRFYALCLPADQPIPEDQVKDYILKNKTVEAETSYKKSFDLLQPETEYTIYALAFDMNDIPSNVSTLTLKTGKVSDDPFSIDIKKVSNRSVEYTVTPKDPSIKYYTLSSTLDKYYEDCTAGENAGDVIQHYIAMWTQFASWYGSTWQEMMKLDMKTGNYTNEQNELLWDADQMIVAFGMNDDGDLVTPIVTKKYRTTAPKPTGIEIKIELARTPAYRDVAVKTTVNNDKDYFVSVQPASYVEKFATKEEMINSLCYNTHGIAGLTHNGSKEEIEFRPFKPNEYYYVIAVGLDEGAPCSEPVMLKFFNPGN